MIILAQDELGNNFQKEITFIDRENGKKVISFGGFETYYMEDLFLKVQGIQNNEDGFLYIDLMGKNHKNSPVYVKNKDILDLTEVKKYLTSL